MMTNRRILQILTVMMALIALPSCKQSDGDNHYETPGGSVGTPDDSNVGQNPPGNLFEPVQINAAPQNQSGFEGQTISFSVGASSNIALKYQWFHNDVVIAGGAGPTLSVVISGAQVAGTYRVDVSNASTMESASAQLIVNALPAITSQPSNTDAYPGDSTSLSVNATGTSISYQWQQHSGDAWKNMAGATGNSLLIANVDAAKATPYRVIVSNAGGSVTSSVATLILKQPMTITQQPVSVQTASGQNASFSIRAAGHGVHYYRWYKGKYAIYNNSKYDGTNLPTLTVRNVTSADASLYQVKVFNDDKKFVFSDNAQLSVMGPARITVQPENTSLYSGQSGSLLVAASGDQPMNYQWQKWNGNAWQNISGATKAALPFSSVTSATAGRYRCQATNAVAQDTSAEATVTVLQGVQITTAPGSRTANEGSGVQFIVNATGDNLKYEWTKNGQTLSSTGNTLGFAAVKQVDEATYGCRVYNGGGSVSCPAFTLTVNSPLAITRQPVSQNTYEGGSATLTVEATGDPTPTVEWYFGSKLVGTGSGLTLNNIAVSQAGDYLCVVKNSTGSLNCNTASVNVSQSVKITGQPGNTAANEGSALSLSISASGEGLSYEWIRNGSNLGINSNTLSLSNVQASDEGTYSCRIWNSNSSVNCNSFTLTVNQGVQITAQPVAASAFEDGSVSLRVSATGKPAPSVDWYKDGTLVRSNTQTLTLTELTMAHAGSYRCVARNSVNTVNCNLATVTVREKVRITKQLANQVLDAGSSIVLHLAATGETPINYQCYRGNSLVVASTNVADLVIPASSTADNGDYRCVASNAGSSATSNTVAISVLAGSTGSALLSWNVPTKRENGTNLDGEEIVGYEVYMATSAAGPFSAVVTTGASETQARISELSPGEYYFGVSTLDIYGLESSMSGVSRITIQ